MLLKILKEATAVLAPAGFDIEVDETDKLITLTTCTRMFGQYDKKQLVVVGRQLRENENIDNYDSKANDNYKEIKKILKGDEQNAIVKEEVVIIPENDQKQVKEESVKRQQ